MSDSGGSGSTFEWLTATLQSGAVLQGGRYRIEAVLGQGGFGITYRAADAVLNRYVAVKEMFPPGCVRHGSSVIAPSQHVDTFAESKQQFLREARNLARFAQRGIVRVYEVFEEANTAYLVMEYLHGPTYEQLIAQGPLPSATVEHILRTVGTALDALHAEGLLHRDVKPSNLLCVDGEPVLIDFGAARGFAPDGSVEMSRLITAGYSPLEQYAGIARFGPTSDIYSLCATCYHLATGVVPANAADRLQDTPLYPPRQLNPSISEGLERALLAGLAIKATDRPPSCGALLALLNPSQAQTPTQPRPQEPPTRRLDTPLTPLLAVPPPPPMPNKRRTALLVGIAVITIIGAITAGVMLGKTRNTAIGTDTLVITTAADTTAADTNAISPTTNDATTTADAAPAQPQSVKVPDYIGASEDSVRSELPSIGLVADISYDRSATVTQGHIIRQNPQAGTTVDRGTRVVFVVSSGGPALVTSSPTTAIDRGSAISETPEQFVRRYYSLVDAGRYDESFTYMVPEYQQAAGGYSGYRNFWSGKSVSVVSFDYCNFNGACRYSVRTNGGTPKFVRVHLRLVNDEPMFAQ